jgi:hypothetical protein
MITIFLNLTGKIINILIYGFGGAIRLIFSSERKHKLTFFIFVFITTMDLFFFVPPTFNSFLHFLFHFTILLLPPIYLVLLGKGAAG